MKINNNVFDVVLRQQLWQARNHGRQLGLGLLPWLVKNAGKAGYTNRFIRRYPNSNCLRTMPRRCHPHTRPTSVHTQRSQPALSTSA